MVGCGEIVVVGLIDFDDFETGHECLSWRGSWRLERKINYRRSCTSLRVVGCRRHLCCFRFRPIRFRGQRETDLHKSNSAVA